MYFGGRIKVIRDERYSDFISHVKNREHGVPLMTVSNHRSMLDDQLVNLTLTRGMLLMLSIYVLCKICAFMYELYKVYLVVKSTPYSPLEL